MKKLVTICAIVGVILVAAGVVKASLTLDPVGEISFTESISQEFSVGNVASFQNVSIHGWIYGNTWEKPFDDK